MSENNPNEESLKIASENNPKEEPLKITSTQGSLYTQSFQFKLNNDFESAKNIYEKMLELNPKNYYAISNLGLCYCKLGNYSKSLELFNQALTLKKNDEFCDINIAIIHYMQKEYDAALSILNTYLAMNRKNYVIYYYLANIYRDLGKEDIDYFDLYNKAKSLYWDCRVKFLYGVTLTDIYLDKAIGYYRRNKLEECLSILKDETMIKNYKYYKVYGIILYSLKKLSKASELFQEAIKLSDSSECKFYYILCLYELKKYDEGLEALSQIKEDDEFSMKAKFITAKIHYKKGNIDTSKEMLLSLQAIVTDKPILNEINYFLGNIYLKEKQYEEALKIYESCLTSDTNQKTEYIYHNMSLCYLYTDQIDNALTYSEKAIKKNPYISEAFLIKGSILALKKKRFDSQDCFNKANDFYKRKDKICWFDKGVSLYKLEKFKEAIEPFNKAISLDPKFLDAYLNRGICYARLGETQQANDDIDICLTLCEEGNSEEYKEKILLVYANIIQYFDVAKEKDDTDSPNLAFYREKLQDFMPDEDDLKDVESLRGAIEDGYKGKREFKYLNKDNINYINKVLIETYINELNNPN